MHNIFMTTRTDANYAALNLHCADSTLAAENMETYYENHS